ncbi:MULTISPECIES: hypothetical protein [Rhodococcus]|uniref:hypothetical protein n=1 Tax=Rhodococcus TaxID=1827 RepID=UPI00117B439F|nr:MULTISPECIES: hypothetical protein [Rhodococcus]MCC4304213.1 hypothetical protein [Rhodococcus sp. 3-2]
MTGVDVEHTKALEAAATPGPWHTEPSKHVSGRYVIDTESRTIMHVTGPVHSSADAEFIAHARTAVPALVAAVERVQALADDLESRSAAIEEANPTHTTQIALHRQHAAMIRQALETP